MGVFDVYKDFRPSVFVDPTNISPQLNILADTQDNFAWAVFGQVSMDLSETVELSASVRYDRDTRENTTATPELYNTSGLDLQFGDARKESWSEVQPKLTLRWQPKEDTTYYADYSRGFRSGGFNQTGVGEAVPTAGVSDVFDAQVAQTFEVGAKSFFMDRRISASLALYRTDFDNAYFFLFDPGTSTQNLGTIDEVTYSGLELEANALISDSLSAYIGIGITDSEINKAADPSHVGNQAPLVSETTMNIGATYRRNTGLFGGAADFIGRFDYQYTGETWWEPGNVTSRSPVTVVDFRVGFEAEDDWSLMLWSKNAFDEEYNTEFSPGPAPGYNFLWKALPNRWGVEFMKRF